MEKGQIVNITPNADDGEDRNILFSLPFKKSAAVNVNAAMDQLFALFPDLYPLLLSETSDIWTFGFQWPTEEAYHIDPEVAPVAWEMFQLKPKDISNYYTRRTVKGIDFIVSMLHSRAILAPVYSLIRLGNAVQFDIVHVDAHDDLMPSLLAWSAIPSTLSNAVLDCSPSIGNAESVNRAIDRGAISKGSFLTAFLMMQESGGDLFHVFDQNSCRESSLVCTPMNTMLGDHPLQCTGVHFIESRETKGWRYNELSELPVFLQPKDDRRIWLDVDLDAFCNRYDGDSDRKLLKRTVDEQNETQKRVDRFLERLSQANWISSIEAVSVAISPGFFPSDYWSVVLPQVCGGICRILTRS